MVELDANQKRAIDLLMRGFLTVEECLQIHRLPAEERGPALDELMKDQLNLNLDVGE